MTELIEVSSFRAVQCEMCPSWGDVSFYNIGLMREREREKKKATASTVPTLSG